MENQAQKPVVNGEETVPSATEFRHSMPQIAVLSRNVKTSLAKAPIVSETVVTETEGVGKVVHIGSEIEDSSNLLDQLENSLSSTNDSKEETTTLSDSKKDGEENKSTEPIKMDSEENESVIDKTTASDVKLSEQASMEVDSSTSDTSKNAKGRKRKTKSPTKGITNSEKKAGDGTSAPKRQSLKGDKKAAVKPPQETDAPTSPDLGSPSKRQRKPKKFEDEEEEKVKQKPVKPAAMEKPQKLKVVEDPEIESKIPVEWLVGDLVWAKVSSHPWWPCMISYDPYIAVYTRVSPKRCREYHVQFFGDAAERGWIAKGNLLEFKGQAQFDDYCNEQYAKAKSKKDLARLKKLYVVQARRKKAVDVGVAAAEIALPMSRNERKAQYTFTYQLPKSKINEINSLNEDVKIIKQAEQSLEDKKATKRKLSEIGTQEASGKAAKKRKVESPKPQSPAVVSPKKRASSAHKAGGGSEGSFEVFCQKERETVISEHPEFTDDMLLDYCRQQWCMMSKKQKARYKTKHGDDSAATTGSSGEDMSPIRRRKPSKKVMEAEEDNKAVDEALGEKKPSSTTVEGKSRKSRVSVDPASTSSAVKTEPEVKKVESKKRGRPSKSAATTEVKTEDQVQSSVVPPETAGEPMDTNGDKPIHPTETASSTVIPAKRAKPKKSLSTESNSDKQSDSGRSTPSPTPETLTGTRREKEVYEYEMEIYKLSSAGPQKKESLCQLCEQGGELLECTGPCQAYFHMECLGINAAPADGAFKCDECTKGVHSCFVCKKADETTQRCSVAVCGKHYHMECVKQFSQAKIEGKGLMCPLHSCHTCLANNMKASSAKTNGRLLRCVRCPTAYHVGDFCISAGSINLAGFNIVCAKHFQPIPSMKHHSHVNVGWCFSCNKGGTLLCCESCPAAYHAECLNIEFPTGSWYCQDCVKGKRPLYGEIIWVKLGNYRWWPGEICHPRNVPLNIQEMAHQVGEFPVHFLGSHEYFWLHQGRVFSFQDGDKGNAGSSSNKGLAKHFQKGLQEAIEAMKQWKDFRDNREQLELAKESKKPAPFKMVKNNVPLGNVTIKKADLSELPKCECKPDQEQPCGRDAECLNGMMMYECHPALCPAGDKCQNQFFTKRLYPPQQPYKTEGRGWGLKAMADIKKGQFVNEYVGDLIDEEEVKRRLQKAHDEDIHNFYMMTLDMDRVIDAGPKGNLSRFMNHCCDPNLETQKWNVNGDVRVGLFALRDIKEGEELTFNYNFDCLGNEQAKCQCGSENCSGYLGVRPKSQHAVMTEKMKKEKDSKLTKLKKKKKAVVKRKHDDDCFRCGEGGELVMCDRSSCTKSYHLQCLGLSKPPYGKWDCPWHHCDTCGKPATNRCVECPNSYCAAHVASTREFDGRTYCSEHDDLLETLEESQSMSAASDDNDAEASATDEPEVKNEKPKNGGKNGAKADKTNGKNNNKDNGNGKNSEMEAKESKKTKDEAALPPKKRGPKIPPPELGNNDKSERPSNGKGQKSRRGSTKEVGAKGLEETLAVAPMFDDDEEEEFGLVIDIPNF